MQVETVQDFLLKLDMKPCLHLVEINIFSLYHFIVRVTKVMNTLLDYIKNCTFKVIFLCQELVKSFQKKLYEEFGLGDELLLKNVFEDFDF